MQRSADLRCIVQKSGVYARGHSEQIIHCVLFYLELYDYGIPFKIGHPVFVDHERSFLMY